MKDWLKKALPILKAVYNAFLKGRKIGGVTLPSEGHGPTSSLEMPHHPEPIIRPLVKMPDAAREKFSEEWREQHGKADQVEPPFPTKTIGLVLFVVFGLPVIALILLGVIEWRTLADDTPGNHITAALRRAFKAQPGAVFLGTMAWVGFLVAVAAGISGHIFWP